MNWLYLVLLAGAPVAAIPANADNAPQCSVPGHAVAIRTSELPPEVLREFDGTLAEPGEPFHKTDAPTPGQENLPAMRLICGYRTLTGYVVERERGGRAYSVGKVVFHRTATGYAPDRPNAAP